MTSVPGAPRAGRKQPTTGAEYRHETLLPQTIPPPRAFRGRIQVFDACRADRESAIAGANVVADAPASRVLGDCLRRALNPADVDFRLLGSEARGSED